MRVYVAGSTKAISSVQAIMLECQRGGHEITFDWTREEGEIRSDWSSHCERAAELAGLERDAVISADALVLVAPPEGVAGLGCWTEVGMALGRGLPVILVGKPRESVFWYLPYVQRVRDADLLAALTSQRRHSGAERFHEILRDLAALHDQKQQDYGRDDDPFANVRGAADWGLPEWVGAMVRATDKVRRLQTFANRGTLANEGVLDAFDDLAVYAVIARVLFEEAQEAAD